MSQLNELISQLNRCETTTQLPQIVKQLNKCILQTLSLPADKTSDSLLLEAFEAMTKKSIPIEVVNKYNNSNSKAISLIIFDNMRQLLIKIDSQKLSLNKEIISELLFVTIGSATENKCKLIELIVKISESQNMGHLLNEKYNNFIIKSIFNKLKTNCMKSQDFDDRNALIFQWIVSNITSIEDYIYDIFPLSMRLIDDFSIRTKIIGLKSLHVIILKGWPQLLNNGSDLLVYERLKNLLYNKETELLEVVFDCLFDVIKSESSDRKESNKQLIAFDRNDQILTQLLNNIKISSDVSYRVIHLKFIDKLAIHLNSSSIKYSKTYINVLCDLLDEPICQKSLKLFEVTINSLNTFLTIVWIIVKEFSDKCLLSLLKLSVNLNESDLSNDSKNKLNKNICQSIQLLKNSDKNSFKKLSEMLNQSKYKQELNESILNLFCF